MPTTELLTLAKELIDGGDYAKVRSEYKREPGSGSDLTDRDHRMFTGRAFALAKQVITKGGTDEEVYWAVLWLYVCIDARKYDLDCNKFWKDHEETMHGLEKKYADKVE